MDDKEFADQLLKSLATTPVPAGLESRILADFDRLAAEGRFSGGPAARLKHFAQRWADRLWPGAPVWQPASVLALSLAVGLMAGAFVPSLSSSRSTTTSESTLLADTSSVMDYYKDL